MASERSSIRDYTVFALLLLNLGATSYLIFRPSAPAAIAGASSKPVEVSETEATVLAHEAIRLYNAKDSAALYDAFDSLAKAQLTREQLAGQLAQLYPVMGMVSDAAFSSAVLAGAEGGREYYHLNFKVRLTGGPFSSGDMRLTVTRRDGRLGLVGFFINGTTRAGG